MLSTLEIYIGETPASSARRRAMRALALDLRVRFRNLRDGAPTLALLNVPVPGAPQADLVLVRQNTLVVAGLRSFDGPISVADGQWQDQRGAPIRAEDGRGPLAALATTRDTLRARLCEALPVGSPERRVAERAIAALIAVPALHPDSRIALDLEDHRGLRKLLGLDELPGLALIASAGQRMGEAGPAQLVRMLGGRLWHDGGRLLFELAPPRYCLRVIVDGTPRRMALPLLEGENLVGRRRIARPHEHRLTIAGDDMISSDHAQMVVTDDGRVLLRDLSKNGTWVTQPGAPEIFLHEAQQQIVPGTIMRMGETRLRLESIAPQSPELRG